MFLLWGTVQSARWLQGCFPVDGTDTCSSYYSCLVSGPKLLVQGWYKLTSFAAVKLIL